MERNERLKAADKCASRYTNENEARIAKKAFMLGCEFEAQGEAIKGVILDTLPDEPNHLEEALELVAEYNLKPYRDGNAWCILLGKDIQSGICGFGDTLTETYLDFLKSYKEYKHPIGELLNSLPEQPVEEPEYYQHFDPDC